MNIPVLLCVSKTLLFSGVITKKSMSPLNLVTIHSFFYIFQLNYLEKHYSSYPKKLQVVPSHEASLLRLLP